MAVAKEPVMWGIHGGKTGDADSLFLQQNMIALGWDKVSDLSSLAPDREVFKALVSKEYPHDKVGASRLNAGQLFRFVHELQLDDFIIYPSKRDKQIHIGKVTGNYIYQVDNIGSYHHRRAVKWVKTLSRTHFSQGALYEIGSAMSFFQI